MFQAPMDIAKASSHVNLMVVSLPQNSSHY